MPVEVGPGDSVAGAFDFEQDVFRSGGPGEWFRVVVPVVDPGVDGVGEVLEADEAAAAEAFVGEFGEPSFDQVEPA